MDNLTLFLLLGILPAILIGGISLAMVHTLTKKQIRREEIQLKRELGELARKDLIQFVCKPTSEWRSLCIACLPLSSYEGHKHQK